MSQRKQPIVERVAIPVGAQVHPYRLPDVVRWTVQYHTAVQLRAVRTGSTAAQNHPQKACWCIPNQAAWDDLTGRYQALARALRAVRDELKRLGSFRDRLELAGGLKTAPNPLCRWVIAAPAGTGGYAAPFDTTWHIPRIQRHTLSRQTPMMLCLDGSAHATTSQRDHVVCFFEEDWQRVTQARDAADAALAHWLAGLKDVGRYDEAVADGRYTRQDMACLPLFQGGAR